MKRLIALLLTLCMVLCIFTGCAAKTETETPAADAAQPADTAASDTAQASAPAGEAKTYEEGSPLKIAYIGWGFADETSMMYLKEFDLVSSKFPVEYTLSDAWGTSNSAEDVVEVLPSLIEAGAQAVIVHSMSAKIVEICNNAQVYFTLSGEVILDQELQAMCDASPYYVGTVALADYDGGYAMGSKLAELGCKNVCYTRTSTRNLEENRLKGAKAALEENGINLVGEYCGEETSQAIRDYVASNPNLDGVIVGNGTNGQLDTAAQTLEALGIDQDVALVSICSPVGHEAYFDNGTVNMIMSGEGFEPFICSMLLINAMYGYRVDEAPLLDYVNYFPITESAAVTDYSVYFSSKSDELPVTADDMVNLWYKPNNPDLNNEWISNWIANDYNIDAMNVSHGR